MTEPDFRVETWNAVVGYEGYYEVSTAGRMRSVDRTVPHGGHRKLLKGKLLHPTVMPSGHLIVDLRRMQTRKRKLVHRLVLEAFVGTAPERYEACHVNGDPADNRIENLYWGTRSDNMQDAVRHGTHHWSSRTHCNHGHEFTPENTGYPKRGGRVCRTCMRSRRSAAKEVRA